MGFRQDGSKRLKKAQKGAKGLKKALEKAVRACPVPPVRPKRLFEPASVPPVRSKRLFETAVRDHYSKVLGSATLCPEPLYSALLCSVHVYARVHTIYIYTMQSKMDRHYALGWCPFCGIGRAHSSAALPSKRSQKAAEHNRCPLARGTGQQWAKS